MPVTGGISLPVTFETISTAAQAAKISIMIDSIFAVEAFDLTQFVKGV